jgi:hypothetical protein
METYRKMADTPTQEEIAAYWTEALEQYSSLPYELKGFVAKGLLLSIRFAAGIAESGAFGSKEKFQEYEREWLANIPDLDAATYPGMDD